MIQLELTPYFDGACYSPEYDLDRLTTQLDRLKQLMSDGKWRTLGEIAKAINAPEASVSAQLRNLRKARFGGYTVSHMRVSGGLWSYRVTSS